ncbi:MAG: hypothetical protein LBK42_02845 [Propionibacteriaceae bacterium]|nr:hypothetical protein [Propionibacteriaceae bacterium]
MSPSVDHAAVSACRNDVAALQRRLGQLERRRDDLVRLRHRVEDFGAAQVTDVGLVETVFADVRLAQGLARSVRETVTGSAFYASDGQLAAAVGRAYSDVEEAENRLWAARRRLTALEEAV